MHTELPRKLARNTSLLMAATISRMVLSFGFIVFAAKRLGVERFGQYGLVTHYFELFLGFTATALGIYLTREVAKRRRRISFLVSHASVMGVALTVIGSMVIVAIFRAAGYSQVTQQAMWFAILALFPATWAAILEAALIAMERARNVTLGTILESVIRYGGGGLILLFDGGLLGLFLVLLSARVVLAMYYLACLRQHAELQWRWHRRRLKVMFLRWRVFAGENWLANLYTNLDVIVLSLFHGEVAVGLYSAAYRVVRLGSVAAKSYTTAVYPVLARLHLSSRLHFETLNQMTLRWMIALTVPAATVITLFATPILRWLYSAEYDPAGPILRILTWSLVLECINPFLSHALFAKNAQHRSLQVALVALLVNTVALLLLVPRYGPVGAAWSMIGSGLTATITYGLFGLRPSLRLAVVWDAIRVGLASLALSLVLMGLTSMGWIGGLMLGGLLYWVLLFVLRVVTLSDFRSVRNSV